MVKTPLYDEVTNIDESIHLDYRRNFTIWHRFLFNSAKKGYTPKISAEIIYKAATDNSWKLRYRAGSDTKFAVLLRFILPLRVFRFVVEKMTGVS